MVQLTDAEALMILGGEHPWDSDKVPPQQPTNLLAANTDEDPWDANLNSGHPWDD